MTPHRGTRAGGTILAMFLALPLVLILAGAAELWNALPAPIVLLPADELARMVAMLFPASAVGLIISAPACLVGALAMGFLADRFPIARPRLVWGIVGGGLVFLVFALVDPAFSEPVAAFGLIGAGAICAALCKGSLRWDEHGLREE